MEDHSLAPSIWLPAYPLIDFDHDWLVPIRLVWEIKCEPTAIVIQEPTSDVNSQPGVFSWIVCTHVQVSQSVVTVRVNNTVKNNRRASLPDLTDV
jgi:hypothetical protein